MSGTVVKQSPDDGTFPELRATWLQWRLVERSKNVFEVCIADDIDFMSDSTPETNFNSDAGVKCLEDVGYDGLTLAGFIKFGRYCIVFFYNTKDEGKKIMWLLKTNLSSGSGSVVKRHLDDFVGQDKNHMSKYGKRDSGRVSNTDNVAVIDSNRNKRISKEASGSEYEESPTLSRERSPPIRSTNANAPSSRNRRDDSRERSESPDPARQRSRERSRPIKSTNANAPSSRNRRDDSRERSESPDPARQRSGDTPGPRDGGEVIYGRVNWGVTRAIVRREKAYDIELVDQCPDNCRAPKSTTGFGPRVDKDLIVEQSAIKKLDTNLFEVVGCAAKWNGKPKTWIYVLIKINDEKIKNRLQALRKQEGETYRGPLICSLTTFQAAVRRDEEQLKKLVRLLEKSLLYKDALENERKLIKNKILGKKVERTTPEKTEKMVSEAKMTERMDKLEGLVKGLTVRVDALL
jgi:hypothetical protein